MFCCLCGLPWEPLCLPERASGCRPERTRRVPAANSDVSVIPPSSSLFSVTTFHTPRPLSQINPLTLPSRPLGSDIIRRSPVERALKQSARSPEVMERCPKGSAEPGAGGLACNRRHPESCALPDTAGTNENRLPCAPRPAGGRAVPRISPALLFRSLAALFCARNRKKHAFTR